MADWMRGDTRNPETILIERESRTCKGCIHLTAAWTLMFCMKFDKPCKRKCARYKERA